VGAAANEGIHSALFFELHEISGFTRLLTHDTGARAVGASMARWADAPRHQSASGFRSGPFLLFCAALLPDPHRGSLRGLATLRHVRPQIHIQSLALDGRVH
jgi:hypothetical protein